MAGTKTTTQTKNKKAVTTRSQGRGRGQELPPTDDPPQAQNTLAESWRRYSLASVTGIAPTFSGILSSAKGNSLDASKTAEGTDTEKTAKKSDGDELDDVDFVDPANGETPPSRPASVTSKTPTGSVREGLDEGKGKGKAEEEDDRLPAVSIHSHSKGPWTSLMETILASGASEEITLTRMGVLLDKVRQSTRDNNSERSHSRASSRQSAAPQILKFTTRKPHHVGTSKRGQIEMDKHQDTSEDAKLARWIRDNPAKTLVDYHTRPKSPEMEDFQILMQIGETDAERIELQRIRNRDLNDFSRAAIVDQGVRWNSSGFAIDVWSPARLQQVRTYWRHQSGLRQAAGDAVPFESEVFIQYENGNFPSKDDYVPRVMDQADLDHHSSEKQPPSPPSSDRPSRNESHLNRNQRSHHGSAGDPPPGDDPSDDGDGSSDGSGSSDREPYYGDDGDEVGSSASQAKPRDTEGGPQRHKRKRRVEVVPYSLDHGRRQHDYFYRVEDKYAQWIEEQVGKPLVNYPPGTKPHSIKVREPAPFQGSNDLETFEEWVYTALQWMKIHHLGGPEYEGLRVAHILYFLSGRAKKWAHDNVEGVHRRRRHWTLLQVIMGLYNFFIHETAIQDATDKFESARYKTNAEEYYQELARCASRMIFPPDKYTFRTRLMEGLPMEIRMELLRKGITAESSSTATIVRAARIAEDIRVIMARYERRAKIRQQARVAPSFQRANAVLPATAPISGGQRQSTVTFSRTNNPRRFRLVRRNPAPAPHQFRPTPQPHVQRQSTLPPVAPLGSSRNTFTTARVNANATRDQSRPPERKPEVRPSHHQGHSHPPGVRCFNCGGPHYANQCTRPPQNRQQSQQMFASRPIVDDNDDEQVHVVQAEHEDERDLVQLRAMSPVDGYDDGELAEYYELEEIAEGDELEVMEGEDEEPDDPAVLMNQLRLHEDIETSGQFDTPSVIAAVPDREPSPVYIGAMAAPTNAAPVSSKRLVTAGVMDRPKQPPEDGQLFTQLLNVDGNDAFTLFDTGCTTTALGNDFTAVQQMNPFALRTPVPVTLGLSGSRGVINYGLYADLATPFSSVQNEYIDVANLTHYDMIVGKSMCAKLGIVLDAPNNCMWVNGKKWLPLSQGEERAIVARRHALRPRTRE